MAQTAQRQRSTTFSCYPLYHQLESEHIEIETLTAKYTNKIYKQFILIYLSSKIKDMDIW